MSKIEIVDSCNFGYKFIDADFLPKDKDEYYFRFKQTENENDNYRSLTNEEIKELKKNGNFCKDWSKVFVQDPFDTNIIRNNFFAGLIRISSMQEFYLKFHDFSVPVGISNSKIISCDIGKNCAIHYCAYLSHYIIKEKVILNRIDEMSVTNHAKFGEGIVKAGEEESVRVKIEVINEAGGRDVFPFYDMIPADAFLWARYREDKALIKKLEEITQNSKDSRRGYYGVVGSQSIIKSCRIIKDVNFGDCVYAKGANKLKNLTIKSTEKESSQIGEGVELINGIIGLGSRVFYGAKAVRFVMGNNCELKYGARLIHSILGDNSTISCCEVLNALIFPYHEQHHNNSFLIAALVKGQSNMAAGATVGSNHNTRGNDGEIIAGRGFWPGLSSTLKHNCKFASFTLLSKGNYPAELDIPFPFSLVIDNSSDNRLEIMPAYYWMYNMYAIERNNKKFIKRDRRKTKTQKIETNYLAPDTAEEIIFARNILGERIKLTWIDELASTEDKEITIEEIISKNGEAVRKLFVTAKNVERSKRPVKIIKAVEAYEAYTQMLVWYGVTTVCEFLSNHNLDLKYFDTFKIENDFEISWTNMGGQLMPKSKLTKLQDKIKSGELKSWDEIHNEYNCIYDKYETDRVNNAYGILCKLKNISLLDKNIWNSFLDEAIKIRQYIEEQIFYTKNKDYNNHFRDITYRNDGERNAVLGKVEDNELIIQSKKDTEYYNGLFKKFRM